MRSFLLLLVVFLPIQLTFAQSSEKLTGIVYDKVVFYDYNDGYHGEPKRLFDQLGQLSSLVTQSVEPDEEDVRTLLAKFSQKASFGQIVASCFDPHFGVVFYDEGCKVLTIEICLSCNQFNAGYILPAQKQLPQGEGDMMYYAGNGMSESFRFFINELLIKYNFSNRLSSN